MGPSVEDQESPFHVQFRRGPSLFVLPRNHPLLSSRSTPARSEQSSRYSAIRPVIRMGRGEHHDVLCRQPAVRDNDLGIRLCTDTL